MMPHREVPIIINSFNRLASLRRLMEWLRKAGHQNIVVIDNASTYAPLLEYLGNLRSAGVARVVQLGENAGHTALWDRKLLDALQIRTEFVYTDPDVVPADSCPLDAVKLFQQMLLEEPSIAKVGFGLRLDDLPETYEPKQTVLAWERQFWLRPALRGFFHAAIDTTFALYRPRGAHGIDAPTLRSGWPYVAAHEGWYLDSEHPTEEELFYRSARPRGSNWSIEEVPAWLKKAAEEAAARHPNLLHIGCGRDLIPGYVNVDSAPGLRVDVDFDLDSCGSSSLPIASGSVDGIYGCHVLEHMSTPLALLAELHRVAKPGARLVLRLPYGSTNDADEDPTNHKRYFEGSFVYYGQPAYSRADYGYRGDWDVERIVLVVSRELEALPIEEIRQRVRALRNVVIEMIVHLRAVKPIRPALHELLRWPVPEISFSRLDGHSGFERV
jgi:SAM-dependent methyltransferase